MYSLNLYAFEYKHQQGHLWYLTITLFVYSSALTCPAAPFVEKSFLQTVKNTLSREGLFVVNLVSRSRAIKNSVLLRMKEVKMETSFFLSLNLLAYLSGVFSGLILVASSQLKLIYPALSSRLGFIFLV